jgi:hypothetical protein
MDDPDNMRQNLQLAETNIKRLLRLSLQRIYGRIAKNP